jgi:hypothetical protein
MKHIIIAAIIAMGALSPAHAGNVSNGIAKSCHEHSNDPPSCIIIQTDAADFLAPLAGKNRSYSRKVVQACAKTMPYPHDWLYVRACVSARLHQEIYGEQR